MRQHKESAVYLQYPNYSHNSHQNYMIQLIFFLKVSKQKAGANVLLLNPSLKKFL